MKKTVSILLSLLLVLVLSAGALAAEGSNQTEQQIITEETTEAGGTLITVDNGDGRVFTIEELPEYGMEDIIVIETPAPEPTEEPEQSEEPVENAALALETEQAEPQPLHTFSWLYIALGIVAVGVAAFLLLRRKK